MTFGLPCLAMIGIGADEHTTTTVIRDHFIEVHIAGIAKRTGRRECLHGKWMVFKIQADDLGEWRQSVDTFFTPGTEQLQCR